jgi:glycosyltransferase involved in cell wall biosynthesis
VVAVLPPPVGRGIRGSPGREELTVPVGPVSIVIPTRDRGPLLLESVSSALSSSASVEVIVADDGSTDGSVDAVMEMHPEIDIVRGPFGNAARARNAGAVRASGDVLAFLDSDDVMLPAKTETLPELLRGDAGLVLVHGMTEVIDAQGSIDGPLTEIHRRGFARGARVGLDYAGLARFCMMFTSATVIRRASFEAVGGYDESLDAYEDLDLYLRLSMIGRAAYAPDVSAHYRVWAGNVDWKKTATWTVRVAEKHLRALPPALDAHESALARFGLQARLVQSENVLGDRHATRRAYFAALKAAPTRALRDAGLWRALARSLVSRRRG